MFMTTGHGPYIINKFMSRLLNMAKIFMDLTYIRPVNMTFPYKNMEDQRLSMDLEIYTMHVQVQQT